MHSGRKIKISYPYKRFDHAKIHTLIDTRHTYARSKFSGKVFFREPGGGGGLMLKNKSEEQEKNSSVRKKSKGDHIYIKVSLAYAVWFIVSFSPSQKEDILRSFKVIISILHIFLLLLFSIQVCVPLLMQLNRFTSSLIRNFYTSTLAVCTLNN